MPILVFYKASQPIPIMWFILHCSFWGWPPPRWKRPPDFLGMMGLKDYENKAGKEPLFLPFFYDQRFVFGYASWTCLRISSTICGLASEVTSPTS
jgi:hypothetical protein